MRKKEKNENSRKKSPTAARYSSAQARQKLIAVSVCAMFAALSILLGKYLSISTALFRISLENLPVLMAGMFLGPLLGAVTGACADLIGCFMVGYTVNPLITIGAAVVGGVSGVLYKIFKHFGVDGFWAVYPSVMSAHALGSMLIKTIGLWVYYRQPFSLLIWRVPLYLVIGSLEAYVIWLLTKNRGFMNVILSAMPAAGRNSRGITADLRQYECAGNDKGDSDMNKNDALTFDYKKAIEYIHSINWCFCKPGLERIGELCKLIGDPQNSLRFVHVAGTNGKGSFGAMLESVLRTSGYKTGMFTSPYVRRFNERMMYNGESITDSELAEITYFVKQAADQMEDKPTEFELITAIGFEYFRRKACDIVILEAGMGGRLDSTNIISTSELSVITGIALDHMAYLGDTEEKIAAEKAGIIKRGVPVLFGGDHDGAYRVISSKADELGCSCRRTDRSAVKINSATLEGTDFDYGDEKGFHIALLGLYQPLNAANVIEAVGLLRERGFAITDDALRRGLSSTVWHARFELLSKDPMLLFDGGHNPEGVAAAVKTVKHYFGNERIRVLTGVMADKDHSVMVRCISEIASEVYTVRPDNPRALDAESLAEEYRSNGVSARSFGKVSDAVDAVISDDNGVPTLALGSLYMYCEVADALDACKNSELH